MRLWELVYGTTENARRRGVNDRIGGGLYELSMWVRGSRYANWSKVKETWK